MLFSWFKKKGLKGEVFVLLLVSFVLVSCDSSDNASVQQVDSSARINEAELAQLVRRNALQAQDEYISRNIFYFGFDLRSSPQEDIAQYLPFLSYLESATGYKFKLYFTPKKSSIVEELGAHRVQFAAMGAVSFLKARSRYGAVSIAQGLNSENNAQYRSFFVVKPNSRVAKISDIRGRILAFGNRNSTQGHLIPRIILSKNKISLNDLRSYEYTGSHQKCAEAVVSGKADVCGMQDQLARKLASQGAVKVIHRSAYYPSSGIVAGKSVPEEVVEKVKRALLDFEPEGKHRQGLYHWDRTEMPKGFNNSGENDYEELRLWLDKLGLL